MNTYKAKVNGGKEFSITKKENSYVIQQEEISFDKIKTGEGKFHVLLKNKSYNAELLRIDKESKAVELKINNTVYKVELKDQYDELLHKLGLDQAMAKKANDLKAPMPGLVLKIMTEAGSVVKKGDSLLILEAMKMENNLKSPDDGKIKSIHVKPGDKVEKGQLLLMME